MNTTPTPAAEPELVARAAKARRWRIHFVRCPDSAWRGRALDLPLDTSLVFGRQPPDPAWAIADPLLSREHLSLAARSGEVGVRVVDLGSRNGTHLCAQAVQTATIGHDTVLRFGETVAVVEACRALPTPETLGELPGGSEHAVLIRQALAEAAAYPGPVAVSGPAGTGKDIFISVLAKHAGGSGRVHTVRCAGKVAEALASELNPSASQGLERADLIAFDDIGELSAAAQAVLVGWFDTLEQQPRATWPRIVLRSVMPASELAAVGRLRRDLLFRAGVHVELPDLAKRRADLLALADALRPGRAGLPWSMRLSAQACEALLLHSWAGNLRELGRVLDRLATFGSEEVVPAAAVSIVLGTETARPPALPTPGPRAVAPDAEQMRELLARYKGNVGHVASHLGRHRKQIYRWLAKAGLDGAALDDVRNRH